MDHEKLDELVKSWINLYSEERTVENEAKNFWAYEEVTELCRRNSLEAWCVINSIYKEHPNDFVLSNLAAGPLEDLLKNHGDEAIVWIGGFCKDDVGFANVLKMVWKNSIREDIWRKVEKLIKDHQD